MTTSLKSLFEAIQQVKDEDSLRMQVVLKIGQYFNVKRSGIFFFDQLVAVGTASPLENRKLQKVLSVALSIKHNPIARYIAERHTQPNSSSR